MLSEENKRKIEALRRRRDEFRKHEDVFTSKEFYDYVKLKAFTEPNYTEAKLRVLGLAKEDIPVFLEREKENNERAFSYFTEKIARKAPYSERLTQDMHKELMNGLLHNAGSYRLGQVLLYNTAIIPPDPSKIAPIMAKLEFDTYTQGKRTLDAAFHIHYTLLTTQPFSDANKRTARLMMNLYLMERGYPPIFVQNKDKPEYLSSMEEKFLKSDDNRYYSFMLNLLERSFDDVSQMKATPTKIKHHASVNSVVQKAIQNTKV